MVKSIMENKVQQFAYSSDEEEEMEELDQYKHAQGDIAAGVKKLNEFVRREQMWQRKTELWNRSLEGAIENHEVGRLSLSASLHSPSSSSFSCTC